MNEQTSTEKTDYMLLFRGTQWHKDLSPEEIQAVMTRWKDWFDRLTNQGKVKAGQPLLNEGKIVSGKKGRVVADGPFAESKEAIGGYFLLDVQDQDEAVAIARECPSLEYGGIVEVRPIGKRCPMSEAAEAGRTEGQLATVIA